MAHVKSHKQSTLYAAMLDLPNSLLAGAAGSKFECEAHFTCAW